MIENIIQIKFGIMINVGLIAKIQKNVMCEKGIIPGILIQVLVQMANIWEVLLIIQ